MTSDRTLEVEPVDLRVTEVKGGAALALDGRPLDTLIGRHAVVHEAADLIEHMIGEFLAYPSLSIQDNQVVSPRFLGAYQLYGLQKEWVETDRDNLTEDFTSELARDPVLWRVPGPESRDQLARYGPVFIGWRART